MYSNLLPEASLLSILSIAAICRLLGSGCDTKI
jgi:hypothetical protein